MNMAEQTTLPMKKDDKPALRRWDPIEMFDALQEEMDRFWHRPQPFWSGALPTLFGRTSGSGVAWAPRTDIYEKDNALIVKAELPGLKKEEVQVELDDGALVIRGETRSENEIKEDRYYRMERSFGSFYRRIPLSFEVKSEQIQATMKDGVLELRIPRPAETKPEANKISVA
jgi:HSP20 family protein